MKHALINPNAGLFRLPTESEWEFAQSQVNGSNVREWTTTIIGYNSRIFRAGDHYDHPIGITEKNVYRVSRGGENGGNLQITRRYVHNPDDKEANIGFRLVRTTQGERI